jgi:hypothetical protein
MQGAFNSVSAFLFLLSLVTLVLIFRDAFPLLGSHDRTLFRHWIGLKYSLRRRAIDNIWKEHVRSFPKSRKRTLFVSFLIGSVVLVVGYQLWLVVGTR